MAQKLKPFLLITCIAASLSWTIIPATVFAATPNLKGNPIVQDLNTIVNFLSGLVGVVVVGVIILGGIQYATAGDKADAVSAAKQRIINGLIALAAFLFIFAFLQWLIPGGIFS